MKFNTRNPSPDTDLDSTIVYCFLDGYCQQLHLSNLYKMFKLHYTFSIFHYKG